MTILFLTPRDPREVPLLWAGTAMSMLRGFETAGHRVHVVTVQHPGGDFYTALRYRWYRYVRNQMYFRDSDPINLWFLRRTVRKASRGVKYDAVFAWLPWMSLLAETDKPRLFWYDTTYVQTQPLYFPNICKASHEQSLKLDRQAARTAAAAVYSSEWSRQAAIDLLGVNPAKAFAVPFGPNFSQLPEADVVRDAIQSRLSRMQNAQEPLRLLFVGIGWERKGGDTALAVLRRLLQLNVPARLTVIGSTPEIPADLSPHVELVGRLNKENPEQRRTLQQQYLQSDWFIMTSRADSWGIVYCEAMAHGLPSIATRTGGVGEIVRTGVTGELFEWSPDVAEQIATTLVAYRGDPDRYRRLCETSRQAYETVYNWPAASARFNEILLSAAGVSGSESVSNDEPREGASEQPGG